MRKYILLILGLIFFNSCNGTNNTVNNSSVAIQKTESDISEEQKSIEQTKETISTIETTNEIEEQDVDSAEKKEEPIEEITKPIKEFNHSAWNNLLQKHVSAQGNVNYKGFITESENFEAYLNSLSKNKPTNNWSKEDKLAYWINAYNAFTIKLIINKYPIKSIKDISSPWDISFIKLGSKTYTLNDIEHKILRKMNEPRIHFAIVCASVSCPKLQNTAFGSSKIEEQLSNATKEFLADPIRNNLSQNSIKISKIFKWFASDFKQNGTLIDFLNKYYEITISQNAKKSYKDYDWNLNE